ncbi:exodeoxyribonuclease III [Humidisolicoccus flavus]|uniref:exodeoxyribonuclease III n=1 Tax=Humidisolicoccus flavus TaxID=3111414 RepID=UPI0032460FDE
MLRIASVNVNGIRAAFRKGMGEWLEASGVDIVTLQEVRAADADVEGLLPGWNILHDAATAKGRAGVAIISREPSLAHRTALGADDFDSHGRWLEADFAVGDKLVTVVSTYVHSGEVDTPKQIEKYKFLNAMNVRLPELRAHTPFALVTGDLNVGHTELDIKNWRGNRKKAGFLPEERTFFDGFLGEEGATIETVDGSERLGHGWIDVGRAAHPGEPGPYSWWSQRGQAFDTDTGWRIDYHLASPELAATASNYRVDRAAAYDQRWSDHAPVLADYSL